MIVCLETKHVWFEIHLEKWLGRFRVYLALQLVGKWYNIFKPTDYYDHIPPRISYYNLFSIWNMKKYITVSYNCRQKIPTCSWQYEVEIIRKMTLTYDDPFRLKAENIPKILNNAVVFERMVQNKHCKQWLHWAWWC